MSEAAPEAPKGRPMKFPYTASAKIAQFPYKFYWKNNWVARYWIVSAIACVPVFYSIQKLSNSPGNIAQWEEKERKEREAHHH